MSLASSAPRLPAAESYRGYLGVLARCMVNDAGQLRHKIDASGIVQETLLQAHISRPQFKGRTEAELAGWLRRILANKFLDATRLHGRMKRDAAQERSVCATLDASSQRLLDLIPSTQTSPSQQVLRIERATRLAEAMSALPGNQQHAIELHHLLGYTVVEVAEQTGRSRASVAGLIRRGLRSLAQQLRDLEAE